MVQRLVEIMSLETEDAPNPANDFHGDTLACLFDVRGGFRHFADPTSVFLALGVNSDEGVFGQSIRQ